MKQAGLDANLPLDERAKVVPSGYTRLFLDVLADDGIGPWRVLEGTGLTPAYLSLPGNLITLAQQVDIYQKIGLLAESSRLTLTYGTRIKPRDHGPLGYAVQAAPDVRQALTTFNRFFNVLGPLARSLVVEQDDTARWIATNILSTGPARRVAAEEMLAGNITLLRLITGTTFPLEEVWIDYDPGAAISFYEELMACPVRINMPGVEMRFHRDLLATPLTNTDSATERECIELCQQRVVQIDSATGIKGSVQRIILENIGEKITLGAISRRLNMSPRSMRRALSREGTSFQSIQDDVRRSLAESYMMTSDLGIDEIGYLLGFTDASNFRNAFKKWTGTAPGAFQRRHAASKDSSR